MVRVDDLMETFVHETLERLSIIEEWLLDVENSGPGMDQEAVNNVFRHAHSIKSGAHLLDLANINKLAHLFENVLDLVREGRYAPDKWGTNVLLSTVDKMRDMVSNVERSNSMSIGLQSEMLDSIVRTAK